MWVDWIFFPFILTSCEAVPLLAEETRERLQVEDLLKELDYLESADMMKGCLVFNEGELAWICYTKK